MEDRVLVTTARNDFIQRRRLKGLQPRNALVIDELTRPPPTSARAIHLEKENQLILASPEITGGEYIQLAKKWNHGLPITRQEKRSMRKHEINRFYGSVEGRYLTFDNYGEGEQKISLLELIHHIPFEVNQTQNFSNPILKSPDDLEIVRVGFLQQAFETVTIFDRVAGEFDLHAEYSNSTLGRFVEFVMDHPGATELLFGKPINKYLIEKPALQVWSLLVMVGLDTFSPTTSKGYEVIYKIDPQHHARAMEIVRERERLVYAEYYEVGS